MSFDASLTAVVLVAVLGLLVAEVAAVDLVLLGGLSVLVVADVVPLDAALGGFANPTLLALGALFVIAAALERTGALGRLATWTLGPGDRLRPAMIRLTTSSALASAFLNNTPVVAMGIASVRGWARERDISPSTLLMPLSFASILGGVCTLIGTSTNLIADGMLRDRGLEGLGFFELAWVGLPLAVVGLGWLVGVAPRLLSDREDVARQRDTSDETEEGSGVIYEVREGSELEGAPVRRELASGDVSIHRITRGGAVLGEQAEDNLAFRAGDRLALRGPEPVVQRAAHQLGLERVPPDEDEDDPLVHREIVLTEGSPLLGRKVDDIRFEDRYGVSVSAVIRHGHPREEAPEDVRLRAGDTLLVHGQPGFAKAFRHTRDFYLAQDEDDDDQGLRGRCGRHGQLVGTVVLAGVVTLAASGTLHISVAAMLGVVVLVAAGLIDGGDARDAVDWSVLLVIGAALGLGEAMDRSGLAEILGGGLVGAGASFGPVGILTAAVVSCMVLTLLLTNNAAVALTFPVVMAAAESQGLDPRPFAIAITLAASLAFATPLGYQTNLMVYGPGGYHFLDFTRVGLPLQLITGAGTVAGVVFWWPLGG